MTDRQTRIIIAVIVSAIVSLLISFGNIMYVIGRFG